MTSAQVCRSQRRIRHCRCRRNPDVILVASGSEVSTLVAGAELLRKDGVNRIVSAFRRPVPAAGIRHIRICSPDRRKDSVRQPVRPSICAVLPVHGSIGLNHSVSPLHTYYKIRFTAENVYNQVKKCYNENNRIDMLRPCLSQHCLRWQAKGWEYKDFWNLFYRAGLSDFAHPLVLAVEAGECYLKFHILRK